MGNSSSKTQTETEHLEEWKCSQCGSMNKPTEKPCKNCIRKNNRYPTDFFENATGGSISSCESSMVEQDSGYFPLVAPGGIASRVAVGNAIGIPNLEVLLFLNDMKRKTNHRREKEKTSYSMKKIPRGKAVIINNVNFENGKPRLGSDKDAENLKTLFERLHFEIVIKRDLPSYGIIDCLRDISAETHENFNALVCCVLSHGSEGSVFGVDGKPVPINDIVRFFIGSHCRTLLGKPKIFFIQACQGKDEHIGIFPEKDNIVSGQGNIPNEADIFLAMSTVPGCVSYRHPTEGSFFIQSLVKHLEKEYKEKSLVEILNLVCHEVSQNKWTQMPIKIDTLRKNVYF